MGTGILGSCRQRKSSSCPQGFAKPDAMPCTSSASSLTAPVRTPGGRSSGRFPGPLSDGSWDRSNAPDERRPRRTRWCIQDNGRGRSPAADLRSRETSPPRCQRPGARIRSVVVSAPHRASRIGNRAGQPTGRMRSTSAGVVDKSRFPCSASIPYRQTSEPEA